MPLCVYLCYTPGCEQKVERWMGSAMLVELPDRTSVDAMLAQDPYVLEGLYAKVETHPWHFGGRP